MPLFFCDVCGREVPARSDGLCCDPDCVNAVLAQEREERYSEEDDYEDQRLQPRDDQGSDDGVQAG